MGGLILKMDIHCEDGDVKYDSCIIFQVDGEVAEGIYVSQIKDKLVKNFSKRKNN